MKVNVGVSPETLRQDVELAAKLNKVGNLSTREQRRDAFEEFFKQDYLRGAPYLVKMRGVSADYGVSNDEELELQDGEILAPAGVTLSFGVAGPEEEEVQEEEVPVPRGANAFLDSLNGYTEPVEVDSDSDEDEEEDEESWTDSDEEDEDEETVEATPVSEQDDEVDEDDDSGSWSEEDDEDDEEDPEPIKVVVAPPVRPAPVRVETPVQAPKPVKAAPVVRKPEREVAAVEAVFDGFSGEDFIGEVQKPVSRKPAISSEEADDLFTSLSGKTSPVKAAVSSPSSKPIRDVPQMERVMVPEETPKTLRDFVKQNPNCSVSDARQHFTDREISKQIRMGRIFQRSGRLTI